MKFNIKNSRIYRLLVKYLYIIYLVSITCITNPNGPATFGWWLSLGCIILVTELMAVPAWREYKREHNNTTKEKIDMGSFKRNSHLFALGFFLDGFGIKLLAVAWWFIGISSAALVDYRVRMKTD